MRKTNLMLIAALVASPFALALGDIDSVDVDIAKTGNFTLDKDIGFHVKKEFTKDNSFNTDNDTLILDHVGNTYKKDIDINMERNLYAEFNLDKDIDVYLAKSKLGAGVMGNSVNYSAAGLACCKGQAPEVAATKVYHTNEMDGSFAGASGVSESAQNVANNSMIQQAATTNAALAGHK